MAKHLSSVLIGFLLLATVVLPSLVMAVFGTSSMAIGTLVVSVLYVVLLMLLGAHFRSSNSLAIFVMYVMVAIAAVFNHSASSFLVNEELDFERMWQSYLLLIVYILGAFSFAKLVQQLPEFQGDAAVRIVFYALLLSGLVGIVHYSPIIKTEADKTVLFYSEPSFFALNFLPLLLYMVVSSRLRMKFLFLLTSFFIALFLESLTLVVGIALIFFLTTPLRQLILILPIAVLLLLSAVDIDYYSKRLDFSRDNTNLSAMVYMQGWERSYLNFKDSYGIGVGFQQFGIVGDLGEISKDIEKLAGANGNLLDGGSVASKFIGEFGILGLMVVLLYLAYFAKSVRWLYKVSMSSMAPSDSKQVFFLSCFVMYFIDLFVRGTGYFSSSGFLFIASLWWMSFVKPKDNVLDLLPIDRTI